MYIANHYVRVGNRVYVKGEALPENLPEEKIKWLKEAGAIHKATPTYTETGNIPATSALRYQEDDKSDIEEDSEDDAEEISEEHEEDDPEPEAPEIDVMAGIVEEPKKKKTTTARKDAAKK